MKKYIIPGILLLGMLTHAYGQQRSYTLTTPDTQSREYIARDYVVFGPGYEFTAEAGRTMQARIDRTMLFPPTENSYLRPDGTTTSNPAEGAAVGAINGVLDVSPTGAATYSIPIECPPGINNIKPNISLSYNSQSGNGTAGIGWNIGGISMISRVNKNIYYDNNAIAPFDWTKDSPFALDGNRLILVSAHNSDSIVYYLEADNFSTVVGYNITAYGPAYFKVYHKNGQVWQYGSVNSDQFANYYLTADGSKRLGWMLTSIVDANGNDIQFYYTGETSGTNVINHRISSISYAHNRNVAAMPVYQNISFDYETRDDIIQTYVDGVLSKQEKRLKSIRVSGFGLAAECSYRRYALDYTLSAATADKSNLTKITESSGCSGADETVLNSTDVSWTNYSTDRYMQATAVDVLGGQNIQSNDQLQTWHAVDIDGDGISEVVSANRRYLPGSTANSYSYDVYKTSNQDGNILFSKTQTYPRLNSNDQNQTVLGGPASCYYKSNDAPLVYVPVVKHINIGEQYNFCNYPYMPVTLSFNIVDVTTAEVKLTVPLAFHQPTANRFLNLKDGQPPMAYVCGDIDNDGFDDFIVIDKWASKSTGLYTVEIRLGSMRTNAISPYYWALNGIPRQMMIADFNKDGLKDICIITDKGYEIWGNDGSTSSLSTGYLPVPSFSKKLSGNHFNIPDYNGYNNIIQLGDVNGDGLPDFIFKNMYDYHIAINSGDYSKGFSIQKNVARAEMASADFTVMDFNDDGKSDIVINTGLHTHWYVSTGTNFTLHKTVPINSSLHRTTRNMAGDFNGDGNLDLLAYGVNLYNQESTVGYHYLHTTTSPISAGTVASITDGMNNVHKMDYKLLSDNSTYLSAATINYSSVYRNLKGSPLCVLQRHTLLSGTEKRKVSLYTYADAVIHLQGKGFLGFGQTVETDSIADIKTETYKELNDEFYMMYPASTITKTTSDALIRSKVNTYDVMSRDTYGRSMFSLLPLTEKQTDHLKGITATTTYSDYDTDGNARNIVTDYGNGISNTQALTYVSSGSRYRNKIASKIVTHSAPNVNDKSRSEYFRYNNKGNITLHTVDSLDVNKLQTSYSNYDVYGNAGKISTVSNGIARSQTMTYSVSGRFVESKTNDLLNETVTYNYDEARGLLMNETDRIGTTYYEYDSRGRLRLTTAPDGIKTAQALQWATAGNTDLPNAKYYSYTETSGQAPVIVWHDGLERKLRQETYGLNNRKIWVDTEYNDKGEVYRVSEPYFEGDGKTYAATYTYDIYGRPEVVTTPMGVTEYAYNGLTTEVSTPEGTRETTTNAAGWVLSETTNDKTVNFTHYANGLVRTATPEGGQPLTIEYDLQGNRSKLTDPDAGVIRSAYNGFGELLWTKQKIHLAIDSIITTNNYAPSGLLQSIVRNGEITAYSYDGSNRIESIAIAGQHKQSFTYDNFDRITNLKEEIDGKTYNSGTLYDDLGRVRRETYPSGYYTVNHYDTNGLLTAISDQAGRQVWEAVAENARGQLTREKRGEIATSHSFNSKGQLTNTNNNVFSWSYSYDSQNNLRYRMDNRLGLREDFFYDDLNRLTSWKIVHQGAPLQSNSISYDAQGNIETKSDLGNLTMNYGANSKPHALASIDGVPGVFPTEDLAVTYTDFKKMKTLAEGDKTYILTYGVDEQRRKSQYKIDNILKETRYYLGNYEEKTDHTTGITEKIHYLSGAIYIMHTPPVGETEGAFYYAYTDNIGSLISLVNENGSVAERYAYDPWGLRRNPDDWTQADSRSQWLTNRGFTMHEMLDSFGIINMNGRVYDPLTAQFFSPDPFVQMPDNWLNYNRYLYVFGNPFKYTDPTGESVDYAALVKPSPSSAWAVIKDTSCWGQSWNFSFKDNNGGWNLSPFNNSFVADSQNSPLGDFSTPAGNSATTYTGYDQAAGMHTFTHTGAVVTGIRSQTAVSAFTQEVGYVGVGGAFDTTFSFGKARRVEGTMDLGWVGFPFGSSANFWGRHFVYDMVSRISNLWDWFGSSTPMQNATNMPTTPAVNNPLSTKSTNIDVAPIAPVSAQSRPIRDTVVGGYTTVWDTLIWKSTWDISPTGDTLGHRSSPYPTLKSTLK